MIIVCCSPIRCFILLAFFLVVNFPPLFIIVQKRTEESFVCSVEFDSLSFSEFDTSFTMHGGTCGEIVGSREEWILDMCASASS